MAAKRGKNQARRSGGGRGASGVTWLLAGLLIGGAVFGYFQFKDRLPWGKPVATLPTPDPDARVRGSDRDDSVAGVGAAEKPKPKYEFYELLPEREVVIPDAELDAQARAEAAARLAARRAAAEAAAREDAASAPPTPTGETAAGLATAGESAASEPPTPAIAAPRDGARYLIQAGAFRGLAEAEALKAKIAMTGEIARIETAEINGATVHRVRMGPYPDASGLAAAKQALASHGIPAQAIRAR
jgi:cell division septation protein DedD